MYKLIILMPAIEKLPDYGDLWPEFLHLAEQMPGLRKEASSQVQQVIYGNLECSMVHELFFDDYPSLMNGLASPFGRQAAGILHRMTRNRAVLMLADHKEDDLKNFQHAAPTDADETVD